MSECVFASVSVRACLYVRACVSARELVCVLIYVRSCVRMLVRDFSCSCVRA